VKASYFEKKYGVDPLTRFAGPLQEIVDEGVMKIAGDDITLNREGMLQVDRLLHGFFLERHRDARYT
jgi:oxygen-independent coproporphyrinogen-3 oxidase